MYVSVLKTSGFVQTFLLHFRENFKLLRVRRAGTRIAFASMLNAAFSIERCERRIKSFVLYTGLRLARRLRFEYGGRQRVSSGFLRPARSSLASRARRVARACSFSDGDCVSLCNKRFGESDSAEFQLAAAPQ